jgi:hypothetical protein
MKNMNEKILRILKEESERYMFFSNLEQMQRQCKMLLDLDRNMVEEILSNGHDWAQDHIAEAKNNMDQVFDFLMNETKRQEFGPSEDDLIMSEDEGLEDLAMSRESSGLNPDEALAMSMTEGRKKAGTKLCARGKAAAKSKFKVYPSAYANGFAVQVCKGRMPGLDGKKKCSSPYC